MPGLRKSRIAQRLLDVVRSAGLEIREADFAGTNDSLPFVLRAMLGLHGERTFNLYFWTVSHGG
jgi:hypothetical protein